jgi:hypothetical protein
MTLQWGNAESRARSQVRCALTFVAQIAPVTKQKKMNFPKHTTKKIPIAPFSFFKITDNMNY